MSVTLTVLMKMVVLVSAVMLFVDPWRDGPSLAAELWFIPLIMTALFGLSVAIDVERLRLGRDANWRIGGLISATRLSVLSSMLGIYVPVVVKSVVEKGAANLMSSFFFWVMAIALLVLAVGPMRQRTAPNSH